MESGFVALRRGLIEHLRRGKMGATELACYVICILHADYKSGIWWGSSAAIVNLSGGKIAARSTRYALEALAKNGYLKRFPVQGKHGNYPILVNRFKCHDGRIVNAEKNNRLQRYSL